MTQNAGMNLDQLGGGGLTAHRPLYPPTTPDPQLHFSLKPFFKLGSSFFSEINPVYVTMKHYAILKFSSHTTVN